MPGGKEDTDTVIKAEESGFKDEGFQFLNEADL
jgi:hypothetical protein